MLLAALSVFSNLYEVWVDNILCWVDCPSIIEQFLVALQFFQKQNYKMETPKDLLSHRWDILLVRIEDGRTYEVVKQKDIVYIRASRNYCEIHAIHRTYTLSQPMSEVSAYLDNDLFIRIGRSLIINPTYLKRVIGYTLIFEIIGKDEMLSVAHEAWDKLFPFLPVVGTRRRVVEKWRKGYAHTDEIGG